MPDFLIPLISGKIAILRVPFPMSEEDFEQLDSTMRIWKKALVKTETPAPESAEATAPHHFPSDAHNEWTES